MAERYEMGEAPRSSLPYHPSVSDVDHQRFSSLNYGFNRETGDVEVERPNQVLSGHRKLNRTFYTGPRSNFDGHANKIVAKLEQNEALMEDTPVSEQMRKEALRDLPQCLTMKRCVKMKLSKSVSQKSKRRPIGFWKRVKYRISIGLSKFVHDVKNFNYFQLWHKSLKDLEGHFGSGYASYFKFLRWSFVMNCVVAVLSFSLLVVPQIIHDKSGSGTNENSRGFRFEDLFMGNGFFEESVFYYGHYTNSTINAVAYLSYDMPAAYFSVTVFLYLVCFLVLAMSVAQIYNRTFIETQGGLQNVYSNRVLCGWDFGIATHEAAELKSSAIYNELKELLAERYEDTENYSCLHKFWTLTIQIVVNILIVVILGAVGWSTWLLIDRFSLNTDSSIILTPIIINLIMMILPSIFHYISKYEGYKRPRTALYVTLVRTYLLGGVSIANILAYWLIKAPETNCWENRLGTEIYRLIVFDFIFCVVATTLFDVGYFITQYFRGEDPKSEFNIAKHTLQIIYNQGLFWVGFIYSPILPALVALKMFIIWYVRKWCVQKFCKPPKRTWRAAQTQTWFMMMVFVSILLIIATHGYSLTSIRASSACGPFRHHNFTYEIVTNGVVSLENHDDFMGVIMNAFKPGGIALIMVGLIILIYYFKEQASAQQEKVKMLKEMVVWVAKDKKYLVQWYNDVTKGGAGADLYDYRFIDPAKVLPHQFIDDSSSSIGEDEFTARFRKFT